MKIEIALLCGLFLAVTAQGPNILKPVSEGEAGAKAQAAGSGSRSLAPSPSFINFHDKCPDYQLVTTPMCPSPKYCMTKKCYYTVYNGYYCGLLFKMPYGYPVKGESCMYEHQSCNGNWNVKCTCRTKFCWIEVTTVIKHADGLLYVVKVWIRRACGCDCYGRKIQYVAPSNPFVHPLEPFHG